MAKGKKNNNQQQVKLDNPKDVELGKEILKRVSETDKGEILRSSGVHYLQNWWKPLIPTPELRPIVNLLARCVSRINTIMQLMTRRKIPVEAMSVVSETKIRDEVVAPITKILQDYITEIEDVLDKHNPRDGKGAGRKKTARAKAAESVTDTGENQPATQIKPETASEAVLESQ